MEIGTIIDLIIAFLALLIAFFEFCDFLRVRQEQNKKKKKLKQISDEIANILGCKKKIEEFENNYNSIQNDLITMGKSYNRYRNYDNVNKSIFYKSIFEQFQKFNEEVRENIIFIKKLSSPILSTLLYCEEEFSFSYGFDRYINILREICFNNEYEKKYIKLSKKLDTYLKEAIDIIEKDLERKDGNYNIFYEGFLGLVMINGDVNRFVNAFLNNENKRQIDLIINDYKTLWEPWLQMQIELIEYYANYLSYIEEMKLKFEKSL